MTGLVERRRADQLDRYQTMPYVPLPDNPSIIKYEGNRVAEYISPEYASLRIQELSRRINLTNFDSVAVNANGGWYLFNQLAKLQGYDGIPVEIAYHRPENAYGAIVKKAIPKELADLNILILEDIYDTGGVLEAIMNDAPNATAAVVVRKKDIPNQRKINRVYVAMETGNYWLGGCGMDFGTDGYPPDFPRNYSGILIMPESL